MFTKCCGKVDELVAVSGNHNPYSVFFLFLHNAAFLSRFEHDAIAVFFIAYQSSLIGGGLHAITECQVDCCGDNTVICVRKYEMDVHFIRQLIQVVVLQNTAL